MTSEFFALGQLMPCVLAGIASTMLTHAIRPKTVRQLEDVIVGLRPDGFQFTTLDDAGFTASMPEV